MKHRYLGLTIGVSVAALMPALAPAAAQGTPNSVSGAAQNSDGLTDIVVTAQRREETAQSVPISITVLDSASLANLQSSNQIGQSVPNVQIEQTSGFGIPRIGIRGIAQSDFNATATTANMVYLDDVPLNAAVAQGVLIWDLGRAEVLRGPQGTLFGRNATGGAIRYISEMPGNTWKGYADVTIGRFDQNEVHAAVGGPVTDSLGIRLSYVGNRTNGDVFNVTLNERQGKQDYYGVRGIINWQVSPGVVFALRGQYFKSDVQTTVWKTTPGRVAGDAFGPLPDGRTVAQLQASYGFQNLGYLSNYTITESDVRPDENLRHITGSATLDVDLGAAQLTAVTGFLDVRQSFVLDNDATMLPILNEYDKANDRQWTQEVRLASKGNDAFSWIVGAFYMHEKVRAQVDFDATEWRGNTIFPAASTVFYFRGLEQTIESWAGFVHTNYEFTPKLSASAAIRYTWEKKRATYTFRSQWDFPTTVPRTSFQFVDFQKAVDSGNYGTGLAAAAPSQTATASWNNVSWKVGLDYKPNNRTLLYALISRGFKGGAFPPTANNPGDIVDNNGAIFSLPPETVTDYEIGAKLDLIPRRLRVNGSAYYYDYRNYQTNQFVPQLSRQVPSSLPRARVMGAELEIQSVPVEGLHLDVGVGITDTKITRALDPAIQGNSLPLAENFNANGRIAYDIDVGFGTITPEISGKYRGKYYTNKDNVVQLGGYALINARIGFESSNDRFYGSLWVKNLTNRRDPITLDDEEEFFGSNIATLNRRSTYGITFGARF